MPFLAKRHGAFYASEDIVHILIKMNTAAEHLIEHLVQDSEHNYNHINSIKC